MVNRVPSGPAGLPVVGTSLRYARDPLGYMTRIAREYGDMVEMEAFRASVYQVTDPAGIERVLVGNADNYRKPDFGGEGLDGLLGRGLLTSDGDHWAAQRTRIQPAFYGSQLRGYADTMVADAAATADAWRDGDRLDAHAEMSELTLRIVVETVLGAELGGMEREIGDALLDVGEQFRADDPRTLVPQDVPTPRNINYKRAVARLDRVVRDIVRQRQRQREGEPTGDASGDDVLGILLRAQAAGAAEVTDEQLRDEVLTMLLAGHDTTALTLAYTWYLLSENPDAERRFHAELDAVLGDRDPTAADAADLDYVEQVVAESMRLYPPAYVVYREAIEADEVAGFHVPAGTLVAMPQWVVHRDPQWWDDPESFRPERFDGRGDRPEYAYFPFGGGPRKCIGDQFAMLEAKLVLATIGRRWELDYAGDGIEFAPAVTLHPDSPVGMTASARSPGQQ